MDIGSHSMKNNGGSTDYYKIKENWEYCQDIIEDRNMNFSQGNIMKAAFTFNQGRHDGTNYERDLNKIIWFAKRELERIKDVEEKEIKNKILKQCIECRCGYYVDNDFIHQCPKCGQKYINFGG